MQKTGTLRDSKYDIIKYVLSLFVLAIHCELLPFVLYPWLRTAVPLFFMLSSYFLFSGIRKAPKEKQNTLVKKFVLRNLKLYLCWFVILLPMTLYIRRNAYFPGDLWLGIRNFLRGLCWESTFVASWFLKATVCGTLVIYGLSRVFKRDWPIFLISLLAFTLVTLSSGYSSCIAGTFLQRVIHLWNRIFADMIFSFPAALIWIFLGKLFAEGKVKTLPPWLLISSLVLSCAGFYWEWRFVIRLDSSYNNDSYFMLLPVCFFLFAGIQRLPPVNWPLSVYLKHASTVTYVAHGSLLLTFLFLARKIHGNVSAFVTFPVVWAFCLILTALIEYANRKCANRKSGKLFRLLY